MPFISIKIAAGYHPEQEMTKTFEESGGIIGRSDECDWILHDLTRVVSKQHAKIIFYEDCFWIEDTSTNGLFLSDQVTPLGKGKRTKLLSGDSFKIGDFVFSVDSVTLDVDDLIFALPHDGESDLLSILNNTSKPLEPYIDNKSLDIIAVEKSEHLINDDKEQPKDVLSSGSQQAASSALPDDWELSGIFNAVNLMSEPKDTEQKELTDNKTESTSMLTDWDFPAISDPPAKKQESDKFVVSESQNLSDDRRVGGSSNADVTPVTPSGNKSTPVQLSTSVESVETKKPASVEYQELYHFLGLPPEFIGRITSEQLNEEVAKILMTTTSGLMMLLQARNQFKQESRLSLTQVQARSNNPLKFCIEVTDALEMMLVKKKAGYLETVQAYQEAIDDIRLHQTAFVKGLQAAMLGLLEELSPEKFEKELKLSVLSKVDVVAHAQYWRLYKERQQELLQAVVHNFSDVMSKYFSDAYSKFVDENKP